MRTVRRPSKLRTLPGILAGVVALGFPATGFALPDDHDDGDKNPTPIAPGQTIAGRIDRSGDLDHFLLVPPSSGVYVIQTHGSTDVHLTLLDTQGAEIAVDDDGGDETNSLVYTELHANERYLIRIRHYNRTGTGAYTLEVARPRGADQDDHANTRDGATEITAGKRVAGSIDFPTDCDFFRFVPDREGSYRFETHGDEDVYMFLYDGDGVHIASIDDGGRNTNSRFVRWLEAGQSYFVRIRHFDRGDTGGYELEIAYEGTAGQRPADRPRPPGVGRIYAVVAGCAEFGSYDSNLEGAQNDSYNFCLWLTEVMGARRADIHHLQDSVGNPRDDVTKDVLHREVEWLASQAQPGDTAVFYYSGHGHGQGQRHFISPHDTDISDLELAEWIRPLRASRTLIVLDSCNSGGFIEECQGPGRYIIAACRGNETASINERTTEPTLGGSDFTAWWLHPLVTRAETLTFEQSFERCAAALTRSRSGQHPVMWAPKGDPLFVNLALDGSIPPVLQASQNPLGDPNAPPSVAPRPRSPRARLY